MSFHIFDLVLIVLVAVSAFFAWRRGFIAETLSIISWVLAFFAALYLGPWLAAHINVKPHWLDLALGYVLVFLAVLLVVHFISHYISGAVKASLLGPADRGLGLVFGVVRALVIAALLYIFFFNVLEWSKPRWFTNAQSYHLVRTSASVVMDLIPDRIDGFTIMPGHKTASAKPAAEVAKLEKNTSRAEPIVENRRVLQKNKHVTESEFARAMPEKRPFSEKNTVKKARTEKKSHSGYSRSDRNALDKLIEKNGEKENR